MFQMGNDIQVKTKVYEKRNSYQSLYICQGLTTPEDQTKRALNILGQGIDHLPLEWKEILKQVILDLENPISGQKTLVITPFVADEMRLLSDLDIPRYLYHRYRYDIFPLIRRLDNFPPYLQIEPTSICNYRCVFCYQIDESFSGNKSEFMGSMTLDLFRRIVDEVEGNIEFISLASRGEPLICPDLSQMMEYSKGKFLNLKVNTNASLMTESHCHTLLCGGAQTIVFSADAATEPMYSKLRVKGNLDRVLKNIERFAKIRETQYNDLPIITRVSGVYVNDSQNIEDMKLLWGGLVDQISFVNYNPWEKIYNAPLSKINKPCSDLWRRMFIWYDGKVNPCDTDYKSTLAVGNIHEQSIVGIWNGGNYSALRKRHLKSQRKSLEPCRRCLLI